MRMSGCTIRNIRFCLVCSCRTRRAGALRENAPISSPIPVSLPVELPVESRLPYSTGKAGRDGRVERGNDRAS